MAMKPGELNHIFVQTARMHHRRTHCRMNDYGLGEGQPRILWILSKEYGLSQAEVGRRAKREPATVTATLARLEKRELVERLPDPDDRRVLRCWMTPAGWRLQRTLEGLHRRIDAEAFAGFSEDERDRLAGYLRRVKENLERAEARAAEQRARAPGDEGAEEEEAMDPQGGDAAPGKAQAQGEEERR
jgi:DNA-binding MarR family transcriptional regulator